jgi:heme-degrading monooxygenase HmoA
MFVVIFEVQPKAERWDDYLGIARMLRPELERIDGFVDNERFKSQRTEGRILSLSTWRDEKALIRWRTQVTHHTRGQQPGRFEIFADYHLRVGEVTADTSLAGGSALGGQRFDVTETGLATVVTLTEVERSGDGDSLARTSVDDLSGPVDREWFASLTHEGKRVLLASWTDAEAARKFVPGLDPGSRRREVRIIRDYGMCDRREAPQYFPDVE